MSTPYRGYTEIPGAVTPDVPYRVNLALREVDADVEDLENRSALDAALTKARVADLEKLGGLAPGDITDASAANLLRKDATETAKLVDSRATAAARAQYDVRLASLHRWLPKINAAAGLAGLDKWRTAYASGKAQMVVIGDSITEGTGTSIINNRWQNVLQSNLRALRASLYVGASEFPFIPAFPVTSAAGKPSTTNLPVAKRLNTVGISGRSAGLAVTSEYVEFSFYGTSFGLMYYSGSTSGYVQVTIDGVAKPAFDANSVRLKVNSDPAKVWSSGPLPRARHTVRVSLGAASTGSESLWLEGLVTYDNDETTGIRILDGGFHGGNSGSFNQASRGNQAAAILAAGGADLVVIGFGVNDAATPLATFRANIKAFIDEYRAAGLTPSFLLLGMYKVNTKTTEDWSGYLAQLASIAHADSGVAFLDLGRHMPDVPTPFGASEGLDLFRDALHPNDAGNEWIAQVLTSALAN